MKLFYPTEPEIITIVSPLGTQHHIPVWLPIGERSAPVMVSVAPDAPRARNYQCLKDRIVEHMQAEDPDNKGLTHWQIKDSLGENRQTVARSLMENKALFQRSNRQIPVKYVSGRNRTERTALVNLWHLRSEEN